MKNLNFLLLSSILLLISCNNNTPKVQKIDNALYEKAIGFRKQNQPDSAFLYFNKAKDFYSLINDSLGKGKSLSNMAFILYNQNDYLGAQELSLNASAYFDTTKIDQYKNLQFNFNNLGLASEQLADYKGAISFYEKSLRYSSDQKTKLIVENNIANSYRRLNNYNASVVIYNDILKQEIDTIEYARVLSNLAYTKWLQNSNYGATPDLLNALKIRKSKNDIVGLNASYSHLSDYYANRKPDSSLYYASQMYQMAIRIKSPHDQIQALQKLIKSSPAIQAKAYFLRYQDLVDSVQIANNASKYQFAVIRFEAEKSKAENLVLQKENATKKYQIVKREIMLIFVIVILVAGAIIAKIWYKKRQQKVALETKNAIRENQLKTSKKVHDVVANGLYRVMTEIDNQDQIDKEAIVDRLDDMYQKSRDISYEVEDLIPKKQNFSERIKSLLNSFITQHTSVIIKGNSADFWSEVSHETTYEIEHVLQELMVNMKKHSKATQVDVSFKRMDNIISISYLDDGIGIQGKPKYQNGLTNTGNRIKHINGEITFDTQLKKGLKILISFPVA
ncbi:MAG: tetratricopeptide repeat-containing sensor histidine kinase [Flavobacterium sp.]|nr:MAG: tetratricopeptide repeat-containing sensor histidine kinase [Flavobacterium sp.]